MGSLNSTYDDGTQPGFLHRVQVGCVRISREILESEAHTEPYHQARANLANRILSAPADASLFTQFALMVDPGDSVDQSIATDDTALLTALWATWNAMSGAL